MGLPQRLTPVARWVNQNFLWLLLASYTAAAVLPDLGLWLAQVRLGQVTLLGEPTRVSLPMLLLACLLANAGLEVRLGQLRHLLRRPGPLLVGLVANLLVPLVFIVCIAQVMRLWHDPEDMQHVLVGLAVIAAMPIAGSATAWSQKADGDLSLSLGLVVCSTFLSLWTTPLSLYAVSLVAAADYASVLNSLAGRGTGVFLFLCVLGPTALGILLRQVLGEERLAHVRPVLKIFNAAVLLLLVYANASTSLPQALARPGLDLLAAMAGIAVSFCVVAFAGGWLVARLLRASRGEETALLFGLGMNNNGTGMVLASAALGQYPQVTLTIIGYNLVQHLVAGAVDFLRARQVQVDLVPGVLARQGAGVWLQRLLDRPVLRPVLSFGTTLAVAVVLVSACASYWNVRTVAATNRWVIHTYEVIVELQGTLSLLKDAETGQRGFLLTGKEHYLEPYHDAIDRVPVKLRRLQALTADNPRQQERLPELEAQIQVRLDELKRTIAARRERGLDAALPVVLADEGKRQMDALRRTMAAMEATEQEALENRAAEADVRVSRALATIVVASALVLIYHLLRGLLAGRRESADWTDTGRGESSAPLSVDRTAHPVLAPDPAKG